MTISYESLIKSVINYRIDKKDERDLKYIKTLKTMSFKLFCYTMANKLPESKKRVIEKACARNAEMYGSSLEYGLPYLTAIGYENGVEFVMEGCRCSANIFINKCGEVSRKKQTGEKTWDLDLEFIENFDYSTFEYKDKSIDMLDIFSKF